MKDVKRHKQFGYSVTDEIASIVWVQGFRPPCYQRYVVKQEIHRLKFSLALFESASEQEPRVVVDTKEDMLGSGNIARW